MVTMSRLDGTLCKLELQVVRGRGGYGRSHGVRRSGQLVLCGKVRRYLWRFCRKDKDRSSPRNEKAKNNLSCLIYLPNREWSVTLYYCGSPQNTALVWSNAHLHSATSAFVLRAVAHVLFAEVTPLRTVHCSGRALRKTGRKGSSCTSGRRIWVYRRHSIMSGYTSSPGKEWKR